MRSATPSPTNPLRPSPARRKKTYRVCSVKHQSAVQPIRSPPVSLACSSLRNNESAWPCRTARDLVGVTPLTTELDNAIAYYQLMSVGYCNALKLRILVADEAQVCRRTS